MYSPEYSPLPAKEYVAGLIERARAAQKVINEYTQDEQNAMFVNSPQPGLQIYQYLVKKAFNPLDLCGSYYRTLDPEYWEAHHK